MDYDAFDAVLHHIFRQTQGDAWFKPTEENVSAGVCLRASTDNAGPSTFRVFPYENRYLEPFEQAVRLLNPVVAVKVRSAAIHAALGTVTDDSEAIYLDVNTRIQILDTMSLLPQADKEQRAAFIRDERVLVVWSDDLDLIIPICHEFDEKLIKLVWRQRGSTLLASTQTLSSAAPSILNGSNGGPSATPSDVNLHDKVEHDSSAAGPIVEKARPTKPQSKWFSWKLSSKPDEQPVASDAEKGTVTKEVRPIKLLGPMYNGLGAGLAVFFIANGLSMLLQEFWLDRTYTRFALLATTPFLFCISLFFALQIVGNLSMVIGPVAQYHENSKYYSAVKPRPNPEVDSKLPHVTIQMPVYKESLEETIAPSVFSLKKAMQTYARQGGTSAIFVNDDGLQLLGDKQREERIAFYTNHNIGWVARPGHSSDPEGFKRAGRFKKASNMNYGLALSLKMEKHLLDLENAGEDESTNLEDRAMQMAIDEIFAESGEKFRPWAMNGRSIRVGEIILIIDSDTIVPEDCFRDAARELAECPEVAIIQHESDVMQVAFNFFENGITHFTRRINKCISMGCANGEVAPFVGHNAFLRWSAIQDAAFVDPDDGVRKMWSESNVSEDFDMALRLQLAGYSIRWATYSKGDFKEGVSLTVDDELNRWQKYAYGCNELIFNPLKDWFRMGPINKQLRTFVWSNAPVHYKLSMMAYMFSYYGIAVGAPLSIMNYLVLGWALDVDGYYMHSFEIWLATIVVFPGSGNLGYTLLEYRLGHRGLLASFIENMTWVPFFFFFFGGLSIHLSTALLAHMFSYNITWGATKKEVERSNFFLEVPKIWKRFWFAIMLSLITCIGMIILTTNLIPLGWRIPGFEWSLILPVAITAGSHILFPIVLNPWLMIFSY